jgi:tRNA modification GTPase
MTHYDKHSDTIVAVSTPSGVGAIGIVRLSGSEAIRLADKYFEPKVLTTIAGNTAQFGRWVVEGKIVDELIATVFRAPRSYTREDVIELSCHGSPYILEQVMQSLIQAGARPAEPGEFTQRAFLAGALDLAQAEAVADLIAASNASAHRLALQQLRGGFSADLRTLRQNLVDLAALLELELDFSEEDVEFADRSRLLRDLNAALDEVQRLIGSFRAGNALKNGIPTVIVGKPNAGKSTLLNRLLNERRAIVSEIPGTTRDVIEDRFVVQGYEFRLSDTAGIRPTLDPVEAEGVERSRTALASASIVLYLFDATTEALPDARAHIASLEMPEEALLVLLANKADLLPEGKETAFRDHLDVLVLSARDGLGLDTLLERLVDYASSLDTGEGILTNQRHLYALQRATDSLQQVRTSLEVNLGQELLALDLRLALQALGEITGEITNDDILSSIFSRFCIGK